MPTDDVVTGAEFGRWRSDFQAFQTRLDSQLLDGFRGVHSRLDELNGRTRHNSEAIIVASARLDRIEDEDNKIEEVVRSIKDDGCSQLANHAQILKATGGVPAESILPFNLTSRKVAVGGGLVGLGTILWPILREIPHLLQNFITWAHNL